MDQKIIQKIKDFYNPQYDNGLYLIVNEQKRYIPIPSDKEMILTFGYSTKNKEDALNHGGIAVTTMDLHKWFVPEDEFKQLIMRWYPDERTKKYLDAVKKNIGLTKIEHGYDGFLPKDKVQLSHKIWFNINGDVENNLLVPVRVVINGLKLGTYTYDIIVLKDNKDDLYLVNSDVYNNLTSEGIEFYYTDFQDKYLPNASYTALYKNKERVGIYATMGKGYGDIPSTMKGLIAKEVEQEKYKKII